MYKIIEKIWMEIVQDVSTKITKYVLTINMAGYSIMIKEISNQTNQYITIFYKLVLVEWQQE